MAKQVTDAARNPGPVARLREFYDEVMAEMAKVTWPSREELKASTSVVLFLLVVVAGIIYGYDLIFGRLILALLKFG